MTSKEYRKFMKKLINHIEKSYYWMTYGKKVDMFTSFRLSKSLVLKDICGEYLANKMILTAIDKWQSYQPSVCASQK